MNRLAAAGLGGATLRVFQSGEQRIDVANLRSSVLRDLYKESRAELSEKDKALNKLQSDVDALKSAPDRFRSVPAELHAIYPQLDDVVVSEGTEWDTDKGVHDDRTVVLNVRAKRRLRESDRKRIESWLLARTGAAHVRVVVEAP